MTTITGIDIITLHTAGVTNFYYAQGAINNGATLVEYCTPLAVTQNYKLRYYAYNKTYNAECKSLTYKEAKKYFKTAKEYEAIEFMAAIEKHQLTIKEVTTK